MIKNDQSILNKNGQLVSDGWASIPKIYNNVEVGEFIIMPNHIHGLINTVGVGFLQEEIISTSPISTAGVGSLQEVKISACLRSNVGVGFADPQEDTRKITIPSIIARFKKTSTTALNKLHNSPGRKVWQRNYYEHVIRNESELAKAREYIVNNPLKWAVDKYR